MNHIDAILYINLEHRVDRREHILQEIGKICTDSSKIHRIDAVKRAVGAMGCSMSHRKALLYAQSHPEWNMVLILEDDFTFKSDLSIEIENSINHLINGSINMDVGFLSYNHYAIQSRYGINPFENKLCSQLQSTIRKVYYSQTASSYLIKKHYIPVLIKNITESLFDMIQNGKNHHNCFDIYWTRLQPIGNWYALYPVIGIQYESYSDIEQRTANYNC